MLRSLVGSEMCIRDRDSAVPAVGANTGFAGVPFGTSAGEFNMICVTSSGHVMFMESTSIACTPDAVTTSAGGQWQGFALGASEMGMQYSNDGIQWQIRNIAPDPDTNPPQISNAEIGDSHALERTITVTLSDSGLTESGLDVSPVPGVGPTPVSYTHLTLPTICSV